MVQRRPRKRGFIKIGEEKEISIVRLGVDILRGAIKALSRHVEYLNPEKLDKLLVNTNSTKPDKTPK